MTVEHYTQRHLRMRASQPAHIRFLLWLGFVKFGYDTRPVPTAQCSIEREEKIQWPFKAPPAWAFRSWRDWQANCRTHGYFYVFCNVPGVIKWLPGRLLPKRWGFGVCGFEFGDRG